MASSHATSSASVLLLLFSLLLPRWWYYCSFSIDMVYPVWLLMSGCTANAASAYHSVTDRSWADRVSTSPLVLLRNFIIRISLYQSCSVGSCTLVQRNATGTCISGLPLLAMNRAWLQTYVVTLPFSALAWGFHLHRTPYHLQVLWHYPWWSLETLPASSWTYPVISTMTLPFLLKSRIIPR